MYTTRTDSLLPQVATLLPDALMPHTEEVWSRDAAGKPLQKAPDAAEAGQACRREWLELLRRTCSGVLQERRPQLVSHTDIGALRCEFS